MKDAAQAKILVIDDDKGPRESLRMLLKNDYRMLCAESVKQGLELLNEHRPDLVIMDIRMPDIDGIEGLRMIRKVDPVVSVIMLTGYGALETAQEALRLGASDYLRKPFETQEIMKLVKDHVERSLISRRRSDREQELQTLNRRLLEDLVQHEHLASLGQASAELVHDLRNPMSVVYGYVQLLTQNLRKALDDDAIPSTPGDALEYLEIVQQNVERCTDLIDVWQNLGKHDPGRVTTFAVPELLREVIQDMAAKARDQRAVIETVFAGNECNVLGDRTQLSRVFHNLIGNAIEALAGEVDGRIRLHCDRVDAEVVTTVEDNGCGMPPDVIEHILEAYYTTKKGRQGTGLGLFITKKIIDDHHGRIDVTSTVGAGSRFSVFLPAWDAVCPAREG